jgi:hypothetical protein
MSDIAQFRSKYSQKVIKKNKKRDKKVPIRRTSHVTRRSHKEHKCTGA